MNDALTLALTTALLASPLGAAMGNRIFPASDVPPDAPFPRCYIAYRRAPNYRRFPVADGGIDRTVIVEILFASRVQDTPQLAHMIEVWDLEAMPYVQGITLPTLAYILRVNDVQQIPQADDRNTYVVGGGQYEALFQMG